MKRWFCSAWFCSARFGLNFNRCRGGKALTSWFLGAAFVIPGVAAPITYNITFSATAGVVPASGRFNYDAVNPLFTNFHVLWNGIDFDVTSAANSPAILPALACGLASTPLSGFTILSMADCTTAHAWEAGILPPFGDQSFFQFYGTTSTGSPFLRILTSANTPTGIGSSGTFRIAPISIPEPDQLSLVMIGALAVFGVSAGHRKPALSRNSVATTASGRCLPSTS